MNFVHNFSDFIKDFVCFCQFKDFSSYIIYGFQYITFCLQCKDFLSYMQHYQCIFKVEGQFKKKEGRRVSGSSPSKGYRGSKWQKVDGSTSEVECNLASCSLQMKRLYMLSVLMAIHLIYTSFIHTLWYTTLCR